MEKVVAIILNYNTSDDCDKCLSYLYKQDYEELNIVIVDNASPKSGEKERLDFLREKYGCDLVLSDSNDGFSAGNNIGLKWAAKNNADWALIINPDVELRDSHYISFVIKEKNKWNDLAVIGTDVRLPSGERQNPQRESTYWESVLWPLEIIKSKVDKKKNRYLCEDKTGYCEKVTGACFFISIPFVQSIGYLDQNVFMYSEEAILCAQVRRANKRTLYISNIQANHEHFSSKKANVSSRMIGFIKSRIYYYKKYVCKSFISYFLVKASLEIELLYWRKRND